MRFGFSIWLTSDVTVPGPNPAIATPPAPTPIIRNSTSAHLGEHNKVKYVRGFAYKTLVLEGL